MRSVSKILRNTAPDEQGQLIPLSRAGFLTTGHPTARVTPSAPDAPAIPAVAPQVTEDKTGWAAAIPAAALTALMLL